MGRPILPSALASLVATGCTPRTGSRGVEALIAVERRCGLLEEHASAGWRAEEPSG